MKFIIIRNPIIKYILSALAVAIFGFILLNVTFFLDYIFQSIVGFFIRLFTSVDYNMTSWYPPLMHLLFLVIIVLISWFVFHSKVKVLYRSIYMTVPLAAVFATIGIFLYRRPTFAYLLGAIFFISVLYYFYKTKKPWIYYYTLVLVSFVMLLVSILGVEI